VYSGDDILTLPMMAVGAVGVVSVASHLAGPQIAAMVSAAVDGDWEHARRLHAALAPLFGALFPELEPSPQAVKGALDIVWRPVGAPRLPLVPASAETVKAVEQALAAATEATR
jgi:4-hydroxy-tetrahydrodipicolinate synthase